MSLGPRVLRFDYSFHFWAAGENQISSYNPLWTASKSDFKFVCFLTVAFEISYFQTSIESFGEDYTGRFEICFMQFVFAGNYFY